VTATRIRFGTATLREDNEAVRAAIDRVLASGRLILGPEVEAFETEFAAASRLKYAVGVGNGTDAIALCLRAIGVGPGDEVITTPLSAAFTALAILMVGARPVFADIEPVCLTLDAEAVDRAVTSKTRAIVPVHLYGQAADLEGLARVASRHNLPIVEDACQAHLATAAGQPVGSVGLASAFSFYPTKNLPAVGDGGAVATNDPAIADKVRRLRNGGQSSRYRHELAGVNSRLDELQAAVLRARLPYLQSWTAKRREIARTYKDAISHSAAAPLVERDPGHVYHLFVVRTAEGQRDALASHLASRGIETLVHYPVSITRQAALAASNPAACPLAERACEEVLSLPLYPSLTLDEARTVAEVLNEFPVAAGSATLE